MDPHEIRCELRLERAQRLVDELAAVAVAHRHVLLVGGKIQDVGHRHELQLIAEARADLRAAPAELRLFGEASQLRRGHARRVTQGARELLAPDRLQQVADRLRFECLQRVLVVGSREDDGGRLVQRAEMTRRFDAVHARHAHVEQHDVG